MGSRRGAKWGGRELGGASSCVLRMLQRGGRSAVANPCLVFLLCPLHCMHAAKHAPYPPSSCSERASLCPPLPPCNSPYCSEHAPSIIFMDEVDSIGSARTDNSGGSGAWAGWREGGRAGGWAGEGGGFAGRRRAGRGAGRGCCRPAAAAALCCVRWQLGAPVRRAAGQLQLRAAQQLAPLIPPGAGDSEVQRTMLELLNQLDGFEASNKIKVGGRRAGLGHRRCARAHACAPAALSPCRLPAAAAARALHAATCTFSESLLPACPSSPQEPRASRTLLTQGTPIPACPGTPPPPPRCSWPPTASTSWTPPCCAPAASTARSSSPTPTRHARHSPLASCRLLGVACNSCWSARGRLQAGCCWISREGKAGVLQGVAAQPAALTGPAGQQELMDAFAIVSDVLQGSRLEILRIHSRKMNLMRGIDLKKIAGGRTQHAPGVLGFMSARPSCAAAPAGREREHVLLCQKQTGGLGPCALCRASAARSRCAPPALLLMCRPDDGGVGRGAQGVLHGGRHVCTARAARARDAGGRGRAGGRVSREPFSCAVAWERHACCRRQELCLAGPWHLALVLSRTASTVCGRAMLCALLTQ